MSGEDSGLGARSLVTWVSWRSKILTDPHVKAESHKGLRYCLRGCSPLSLECGLGGRVPPHEIGGDVGLYLYVWQKAVVGMGLLAREKAI